MQIPTNFSMDSNTKARELFYSYLSPLQRRQLLSSSWQRIFAIGSYSGKSYEIKLYRHNTQNVFSGDRRFCTVPKVQIPLYDKYLTQKLMIENDEPEFLRVAEKFGYYPLYSEPELSLGEKLLFMLSVCVVSFAAIIGIAFAYFLFGLLYNYFFG